MEIGKNIMNAVRQLYENLPKVIKVPDVLKNRRVEVIMLPLNEEDKPEKQNTRRKMNPIDEFIGAWEPLVRPDQGEYEVREPLNDFPLDG